MITFSKKTHPLEVNIHAVSAWDGFDKLIRFMQNEYAIKVIDSADGPDARRWILEAEEQQFELRFEDPYGNSLIATCSASESIVRKVGLDLESRFKNV